jgi:hypothetical protein
MRRIELVESWRKIQKFADREFPRLWFYRAREEAPFAGCLPGHPLARAAELAAQASRVRILYAPDEWDELELE